MITTNRESWEGGIRGRRVCEACDVVVGSQSRRRRNRHTVPSRRQMEICDTVGWKVRYRCEKFSTAFRVMVRAPLEHKEYRGHHIMGEPLTSPHDSRRNHRIMVLVRTAGIALKWGGRPRSQRQKFTLYWLTWSALIRIRRQQHVRSWSSASSGQIMLKYKLIERFCGELRVVEQEVEGQRHQKHDILIPKRDKLVPPTLLQTKNPALQI